MEIKLSTKENINDLYRLWQMCFGDDKTTIDSFFEHSFDCENTIVCTDNGKVISMAFMIPEIININNNMYNAYYLYALATDVEYRKRGVMSAVLKYAEDLAKSRDFDYLFLVPASENLFLYYKKLGFENAFLQKRISVSREVLNFINSTKADVKGSNLKDYKNIDTVDWRQNEIDLACDYFRMGNGEVIKDSDDYYFIEHKKDMDVVFTYPKTEPNVTKLLSIIGNHITSDFIKIHTVKDCLFISNNQEIYNCGMSKSLKENLPELENVFMGITLQ